MTKIYSPINKQYEGHVLHNDDVKAGLYIRLTLAQRNAIPRYLRDISTLNTTLCYVKDHGIYELINEPETEQTTDSDWKLIPSEGANALKVVGTWDPNTNTPSLQDAGASGNNGDFYLAINTPNPTNITIAGLFGGSTVQISNNDMIVSVGNGWEVISPSTTWDAMNKPAAIVNYVNGQVITHQHSISDVEDLQTELDNKFDSEDVADNTIAYNTVPDNKITDKLFVKTHHYHKNDTYSKGEVDAKIPDVGSTTYSKSEIDNKDDAKLQEAKDYANNNFDTSQEVDSKINNAISDAGATINFIKLQLTPEQVKALGTTPIEIISAPGENKYIDVTRTILSYNHNTSGYSKAGLEPNETIIFAIENEGDTDEVVIHESMQLYSSSSGALTEDYLRMEATDTPSLYYLGTSPDQSGYIKQLSKLHLNKPIKISTIQSLAEVDGMPGSEKFIRGNLDAGDGDIIVCIYYNVIDLS